MSVYEYWIGKDINLKNIWADYEEGLGYVEKYKAMEVYLIQFTFNNPASDLPLFNLEVLLKTFKAYFHEVKLLSLSPSEYNEAGPLFTYEINRGSAIWTFLGGLRHLVLFGTTIADEQVKNLMLDNTKKELEILDKKLELLQKYFGGAVDVKDFKKFMDARKPEDLNTAISKLQSFGIKKVEISQKPFEGDINNTRESLIDIKKELGNA